MNRPLVLGLTGAVIVGAAIGLTYIVDHERGEETAAVLKTPDRSVSAPVSTASQSPIASTSEISKTASATPKIENQEDAVKTGPQRPTFDVVRVNPRGDAVIAGRAAPDANVIIRDGKTEIGQAKADSRGEWVVVPKQPLPKGSRELTLSATSRDGTSSQADRNVVIVVPDRKPPQPGQVKSNTPPGALAVSVPREGMGGSIVIQKPSGGLSETVGQSVGAGRRASLQTQTNDGRGESLAGVPTTGPVSIDAVDYDEAGNVTIGGMAAPGVPLSVYIDNKHAASGVSDRQGRWRVVPGGALPPGIYTLRVDHLGSDGKVISRAETRFTRAKPVNVVPGKAVVFVEPGNSLWRIARRVYGAGIQYSIIFDANREQIRDPDLIYPGQVFFVPHAN